MGSSEWAVQGRRPLRELRGLGGVLLVAFGLRLGWVLLARLDPGEGDLFDMVWYHLTAHQIAAGNGVTRLDGTPTAVWPPLYPALLAPLYRLTGGSVLVGALVNPFFGVLTAAFVYGIGRRLVGPRAGLVAAACFAACPDDILFGSLVMSEPAFGAIFTGTAWLFTVWNQRRPEPRRRVWFALGVACGLATLTRGIALAWPAAPILVWIATTRSLRASLPKAALVCLGLACTLAPWTLRNHARLGAPVLVATSLGRTLAHAHSPYETGGPSLKAMVYRNQVQKQFEHLPQPRMEIELNRAYTRLSLAYMLTHPGHELRVLPNRVRHLFRHGHAGLEIGRARLASGELEPFLGPGWHRAIAGLADLAFYALLALAGLGLPRLLRAPDRTALLVPLTLGYVALLHLLLFPADPRYHHPMLPFLAVAAGALLAPAGASGRASRSAGSPPPSDRAGAGRP